MRYVTTLPRSPFVLAQIPTVYFSAGSLPSQRISLYLNGSYAEAVLYLIVLILTSPRSTTTFWRGRENCRRVAVHSYNDSAMFSVLLNSAFPVTAKKKHCFSFQEQEPRCSTLPDLLYALRERAISVLQRRTVIFNYLLNLPHSYTLTSETCKNLPLFLCLQC